MRTRLKNILILLITLTSLLIFLLPFCWIIEVKGGEGNWEKLYLIQDWLTLIFYLPFIILWIVYLFRRSVLHFSIFRILLGSTAFITFALSYFGSTTMTQDYAPGWGENLAILLFPFSIIFLWIANKQLPTVEIDK